MLHIGRVMGLITWLLIGAIQPAQKEYRYVIVGRAVNEQGQPVPFAYTAVTRDPNNQGGDFVYTGLADAEGHLRFDIADSNLVRPTRLLFVTGPLPPHAVAPVTPPFENYHSLVGPEYSGRLIMIKKKGEVDIGDVPVSFFYGAVKVLLQDQSGAPLVKDTKTWGYVWLRIRNSQGQEVTETSLSIADIERLVNLPESSVMVALPEGEWYIDVSLHENKGPWLTAELLVQVKPSNQLIPLVLKQP